RRPGRQGQRQAGLRPQLPGAAGQGRAGHRRQRGRVRGAPRRVRSQGAGPAGRRRSAPRQARGRQRHDLCQRFHRRQAVRLGRPARDRRGPDQARHPGREVRSGDGRGPDPHGRRERSHRAPARRRRTAGQGRGRGRGRLSHVATLYLDGRPRGARSFFRVGRTPVAVFAMPTGYPQSYLQRSGRRTTTMTIGHGGVTELMSARQGFRSSNSGFEGNGFQGRADSRVEQLRVPPQSVEAEQAVLGGSMLVPDAFDRVADILADNDFYRRDHQLIYRAIRELAEKNRPYDAVTLGEWFESMGQSEQVAGGAYLVELASTTPSAANIVAYAEIVRDKAVLRQLIEVGTGIVNDGFQPDGRETSEILDAAESSVLAIAEHSAKGRMEYVTVHNALAEAFDVLQKRYESGGSVTGLPTGYTEFDEMTAGPQPTDLLILAARPSMGKCLSADSEIVLDDGSVATIEQICKARSGRLGTLDEDYRLARAEPSDFVDDGIKPTFEVVTRLGRRVETTAPHPFLTVDGWKPLHQLSVGDYVAVPR